MELDFISLPIPLAFEWDEGNELKNWLKHGVSSTECEQVFFNQPLMISQDSLHSYREPRYRALGRTNADRLLLVAFTVRKTNLRIISARDQNRLEKNMYTTVYGKEFV